MKGKAVSCCGAGAVGAVRGRAGAAGAGERRGDPARQPAPRARVRALRAARAASATRPARSPRQAAHRALHLHAPALRQPREERQEGRGEDG